MSHQVKNNKLRNKKEIREYFKQKYNWDMTQDDYQEVSQSLYYLGKAIHNFLELENKQKVYNLT